MATTYQYNASGYFVGEVEDYGLLPNNATHTAPKLQDGYVPRWTGEKWEQVQDHKSKKGYVDGKPFTIKEYGPLPEAWSDTPPPPTQKELDAQRRAEILVRLQKIDAESVRPLRALANGEPVPADTEKLAALDQVAETLRAELAALGGIEAL